MKKLIIPLFACIFLIAGCDNFSFSPLGGVDMAFLEDSPPGTFEIGEGFTVALKLTNSAGFDISNGKICIDDTNGDDGVEPSCKTFSLKKYDQMAQVKIKGSTDVDFENDYSYKYGGQEGLSISQNIIATAEYMCPITSKAKVCIKYDTTNTDCAKTETISGSKLTSTVGPVTVTKLKKNMVKKTDEGVMLYIDVYLTKLKSGNVKNDKFSMEVLYDNIPLECEGTPGLEEGSDWGEVTYTWEGTDTEKVIKCKRMVDYTEGEPYEANLDINLDYSYVDRYSKSIIVKNPIGGETK
jgi:hypothetical protein